MGKPAGDRLCRFFVSRETVGGVVLCLVKKFSLCQLVLLSRAVVSKPLHRLTAVPLPFQGRLFLPCEFPSTKIPRRGEQAAAAAVTLPFSHLKLGRKVSGDPPLSLLKRKKEAKKEKSSRFTCTVRFKYHTKITRETIIIDSHQQKSPGGANRRLPPP
ncbi:hypothetical protein [uncultured Ruminococcus sp.]|uniref:hypothetical protein n=1 Tax=uncultured Ruminococcus sp. TaxID=165186 RepID=UPI00258B8F37|nr:hypothetical protein [uncultured Ruminococcus sp.]